VKNWGFMLGFVGLLTACSSFNPTHYASNDRDQYLKSRNGPLPVVAPPLTTSNISDFYNLPPQTENARVSIVPPVE